MKKCIVTVVGKDHVGIIANVCNVLAANKINILDISQTILDEYFTMTMLVDIAACEIGFDVISQNLKECGEKEDLEIRIQRTEIFDAMHRI